MWTRREENGSTPCLYVSVSSKQAQAHLCLALRVCAGLVCARDTPFHMRVDENAAATAAAAASATTSTPADSAIGGALSNATTPNAGSAAARAKKTLSYSADIRGLRLLQICEFDSYIFLLLSAIAELADRVRSVLKYSDSPLPVYTKCALLAMCEEEWVVRRCFWICEARRFDAFKCSNSTVSRLSPIYFCTFITYLRVNSCYNLRSEDAASGAQKTSLWFATETRKNHCSRNFFRR